MAIGWHRPKGRSRNGHEAERIDSPDRCRGEHFSNRHKGIDEIARGDLVTAESVMGRDVGEAQVKAREMHAVVDEALGSAS